MKTLAQVFDDIENGKQKEVCYTAIVCAMAERICSACQFAEGFKTPQFGCGHWIIKELRRFNERKKIS